MDIEIHQAGSENRTESKISKPDNVGIKFQMKFTIISNEDLK